MFGQGYSLEQALNFGFVFAYNGTGSDQARLIGSASSSNVFDTQSGYADVLGNNFQVQAYGFSSVNAYAGTASDTAYLRGSTTSNNLFSGNFENGQAIAHMQYSNGYVLTFNVGTVYAYAGTSSDKAYLYGSTTSENKYEARATFSTLSSAAFFVRVIDFRSIEAHAGTASDHAEMYGSTTSTNYFTGRSTYSMLVSTNHSDTAVGFRYVNAYSGTSADSATLYGSSDPAVTNTFIAAPFNGQTYGDMYSSTYQVAALNFSKVTGFAGHSWDKADLFGSSFAYLGYGNWAANGSGYYNEARDFGFVSLHAV
jgi:hypothetical protein